MNENMGWYVSGANFVSRYGLEKTSPRSDSKPMASEISCAVYDPLGVIVKELTLISSGSSVGSAKISPSVSL